MSDAVTDKKDGGPAFGQVVELRCVRVEMNGATEWEPETCLHGGLTVRDYFAAKCSDDEVAQRIPKTVGGIADRLVALGWITVESREADVTRCFDARRVQRLRALVRYEYADDMIAAREL